jgi:hypothetical protein
MSKNEYARLFQTSRFVLGRVAIVPVKMWLSPPIAVAMAQKQIPPAVHVHSAKVRHHAQWKGDSQNTLNAFDSCREALLKNEIDEHEQIGHRSWGPTLRRDQIPQVSEGLARNPEALDPSHNLVGLRLRRMDLERRASLSESAPSVRRTPLHGESQ